jgi:hypothetical protein
MSHLNELKEISTNVSNFFDKFITTFNPDMSDKKFNKFRLYFINLLTEVNILNLYKCFYYCIGFI